MFIDINRSKSKIEAVNVIGGGTMFKYFYIKHFRGFEELEFKDLRQVTIIGGKNNVGKTSLLESLFIHCGQNNAELFLRTNIWRGMLPSRFDKAHAARYFLGPSFHNQDLSVPISFESTDTNQIVRRTRFEASTGAEIDATTILPLDFEAVQTKGEGVILTLGRIRYEETGAEKGEYNLVLSQREGDLNTRVVPPPPPPSFAAHFIHENLPRLRSAEEDAVRYSNLREQGREEIVLNALRAIDPSISRLELLSPMGSSMLYAELTSGRRIPLPLLGDGAVRLVKTLLTMSLAADGILLIDEVGYELHYSVLSEVWKVIAQAAQVFNTQVIAATHSFEVIRAAHISFSEEGWYDQFGYIRLEKIDEKIRAVQLDRDSLQLAIERGFEVR